MAHPPRVKASALSMLLLGDNVAYVAKTLGIPKQTVSRWKPEADAFFREIFRSSPQLREVAAVIRQVLPGLSNGLRPTVCDQNGTKKKEATKRGKRRGVAHTIA